MPRKAIDLQAVRQAEERLKRLLEEHPELRDPERQEALAAWLATLEEWKGRIPPMAKKGRPFTYQSDDEKPVTISMRVPKELHTRLERYAKQHRQPISELMRDGIEWRIGDGDPRGLGDGAGTHNLQEYYGNTEREQEAQEAEALQEVRALLRQQWEQIQTLAQAFERQKVLPSDVAYSSNTAMTATVSDISHDNNTVIQEAVPKRRGRKAKESPSQEAQSPKLAKDPTAVAQARNGNTVLQETAPKRLGRKPVLREPILALLREHPAGLTAVELKVYLKTEKHIGDTLAGMTRDKLLVKLGTRPGLRYQRANT